MCRRHCVDEGPWGCHEEGCPARVVTCPMLAVACKARFGDIWRKPPYGTAKRLVAQACPLSCGECMSDAPLDRDAEKRGEQTAFPSFLR